MPKHTAQENALRVMSLGFSEALSFLADTLIQVGNLPLEEGNRQVLYANLAIEILESVSKRLNLSDEEVEEMDNFFALYDALEDNIDNAVGRIQDDESEVRGN